MERNNSNIVHLRSWLEMIGYLTNGIDVAVKDLVDDECFWIDANWVGWIMNTETFQEGYDFYAEV
jgi:hypothetical protein